MDTVLVILLVVAAVKLIVFGGLLTWVFQADIGEWLRQRKAAKTPSAGVSSTPACVYCGSVWTRPLDEGKSRWEDNDLVIVTSYRCEHCDLPFWHVDRVKIGTLKT